MKAFKAPTDDILFTLSHVAGGASLPDYDASLMGEVIEHFATFAEREIAPLDASGDRQGAQLVNGRVIMPDGFKAAYEQFRNMGWPGSSIPERFGGQGMSDLFQSAVSEIFAGANHSFQMVTGLVPGAVRVLMRHGAEDQQNRFIPRLADGSMLSTMCLTEPEAGSDLSRIRCAAIHGADGWRLHGGKIFISGGDQDLSEDILHLVLARTGGSGIKGLSLFICPSTSADGIRNQISVARLEEKMGLHASPTCHMVFDGAQAELVGETGSGLAAMFTLMNHARIDVALQGAAHAARAHDIARHHAENRVQGRNPDGSDARLTEHPEIRDMVDQIDAAAFSARAFAHLALVKIEEGGQDDLVAFLTPLAKVAATELGIRAAEIGMQVLGGYGYLRDYRIEQTYRDARVTAIYEGANGIHARQLATRLASGPAGKAFAHFLEREAETDTSDIAGQALKTWRGALASLSIADDATTLARQFTDASIAALRAIIWLRLARSAHFHPEPERIQRLCFRELGPSARMIFATH